MVGGQLGRRLMGFGVVALPVVVICLVKPEWPTALIQLRADYVAERMQGRLVDRMVGDRVLNIEDDAAAPVAPGSRGSYGGICVSREQAAEGPPNGCTTRLPSGRSIRTVRGLPPGLHLTTTMTGATALQVARPAKLPLMLSRNADWPSAQHRGYVVT